MNELNQYLYDARNEALSLGHCYVGSQHFLLSLLHHHDCFAKMMQEYKIDYLNLREELKQMFTPQCSCYPMDYTLQLERLSKYQSIDEVVVMFLKERCSVASELLAKHGVYSEQLALYYQMNFHVR